MPIGSPRARIWSNMASCDAMSAPDLPKNPVVPDGLDVPADLLDIDPEQLRALGYWVVDRTIEHLATLNDRPAITTGTLDDLTAALGGPVPQSPTSVDEGLRLLADIALENQQHGDHPRYFARVPAPSSYPAILGEWLATGMQGVSSSWGGGSGTATIELVVHVGTNQGVVADSAN